MLLVEQNGRPRKNLPGINQGQTVGIHFSVPTENKDQHFRLEGAIVRVMETGVGINFPDGMDEDAMRCLSEYSGLKPASPSAPQASSGGADSVADESAEPARQRTSSPFLTGGLKPTDAKRVVTMLRKEAAKIVPEMTASLFSYMDSELLELAKDAKSNAEQSEYFAAMSSLEKAKKQVSQDFLNDVLNQFDEPRDLQTLLEERRKANEERKAQSQKKIKLSLVNTEEFEDWLAVANIIQRSERSYEKYQNELLQRMGMIVDSWSHSEANPLGTSVFSHAFDDAIRQVDLSKEIRQKVYTGYESNCIPLFRKLYITTTKLLEESELFPDLDEDYIAPASVPEEKKEEEKKPEPEPEAVEEEEPEEEFEDEEDDYEDDFEDEYEEPRPRRRRRSAPPPQSRRRGSRRRPSRRMEAPEPMEEMPPRRQAPVDDVGDAIRSIYSSVRDLMGQKGEIDYADDYEEDADYFETEEVQDLLSTLEDEILESAIQSRRIPVRERLLETASLVGGRRVAPEQLKNIEVVENLVDTIEEDELLSGNAKNWIRQLELTLDKVAMGDDEFLSEKNPHRSLEVVNQIARLGGAESGSAKRVVDEIVTDINQNYDEDPEVFDRALGKLQPIVERQNRAFTGNVQRTVKASEGQQTLINAQRAVVNEMDQRYAGKEVPEILYKLLMPGWRNLLVNTHLRQGENSADWNNHVRALDQVFQHLDEGSDPVQSPDYMPPEELIEHIESGLDSISYEPGQRIPLINSLRSVIQGEASAAEMPRVALRENTIAENLGFSDVTKQAEERRRLRDEKADDTSWQKCLERVARLHVGAWVEFSGRKEEPEIAIVAWVDEEGTRYVFVNRRGVKTTTSLLRNWRRCCSTASLRSWKSRTSR